MTIEASGRMLDGLCSPLTPLIHNYCYTCKTKGSFRGGAGRKDRRRGGETSIRFRGSGAPLDCVVSCQIPREIGLCASFIQREFLFDLGQKIKLILPHSFEMSRSPFSKRGLLTLCHKMSNIKILGDPYDVHSHMLKPRNSSTKYVSLQSVNFTDMVMATPYGNKKDTPGMCPVT